VSHPLGWQPVPVQVKDSDTIVNLDMMLKLSFSGVIRPEKYGMQIYGWRVSVNHHQRPLVRMGRGWVTASINSPQSNKAKQELHPPASVSQTARQKPEFPLERIRSRSAARQPVQSPKREMSGAW
jgi:hypothetical protein